MNQSRQSLDWRGLTALFLISTASLALEVLQMRVLAFVLWHHLAFLVISVALLGFAAAGTALSCLPSIRKADPLAVMSVCGLCFSVFTLLGAYLFSCYPLDIFDQVGSKEMVQTGIFYFVFALPYFFAGFIVAIALSVRGRSAGFVYFINLVGSGTGCFFVFVALPFLNAQACLVFIAALGGISGLLGARRRTLLFMSVGLVGILIIAIPFADSLFAFKPAASKFLSQAMNRDGAETVFSKWTPLCRIDVVDVPGHPHRLVFQDGDAPTLLPITSEREAPNDIRNIPQLILDQPKVLVLGVGGGLGAKVAVQNGAREVVGVDINAVTLSLSLDPAYSAFAEQLNENENVHIEEAEGRFFVRSSEEKFDLIQMNGVDTYTALASGSYVLSESYLYTQEAFHDYLDHLTDDGVLSIMRFSFPVPREMLRIAVMAMEALKQRGADEPWRHLVVLIQSREHFSTHTLFGLLLIKTKPFTDQELDLLRKQAENLGFRRDFFPDEEGIIPQAHLEKMEKRRQENPSLRDYPLERRMNPFYAYAHSLKEGTEENFISTYPYNVEPVFDDAPFFFNQHRLSALWAWLTNSRGDASSPAALPWIAQTTLFQTQPLGLILLFLTLVQLGVLVMVFVFLPLAVFKRRGIQGEGRSWVLGYFLCLGFGYIFLMISSMQRFGLMLGHPTYAVSIVMALFLVCSGLGSWVSSRIRLEKARYLLIGVAVFLLVETALLQWCLPSLTQWILPQAFPVRVIVIIALLSPMAFVMGMCFPTGIRHLNEINKTFIPWAYCVNGSASVLGSVVAVCLALVLGFTKVQWIASFLYLAAAFFMLKMTGKNAKYGDRPLP